MYSDFTGRGSWPAWKDAPSDSWDRITASQASVHPVPRQWIHLVVWPFYAQVDLICKHKPTLQDKSAFLEHGVEQGRMTLLTRALEQSTSRTNSLWMGRNLGAIFVCSA